MNKVTSKVVMTLMGYATDELDPKDYVDAHLFYDLFFAAFYIGCADGDYQVAQMENRQ